MARSEAQKAADKRYAEKTKGRYDRWTVYLLPDEMERIEAVVKSSGMSKADFLRWAVRTWQEQNSN